MASEWPAFTEEKENKVIVTVTGGCGFLAQHLLKLLHTSVTDVTYVRVLDFIPFKQTLEYSPVIDVHSVVGSVTAMEDLLAATTDTTTVFHLASVTDRRMFPDHHIATAVNVTGTANVVQACLQNGVKNLIYVSDTSVVMGNKNIVRGTESSTTYPKMYLHESDGQTKSEAETLVLEANGTTLIDGKGQLKTLCIRPVTMYGEMDSYLFPQVVKLAASNEGHLPCVGSMRSKSHFMYVGNTAWALLCANNALNRMSGYDPSKPPILPPLLDEPVSDSAPEKKFAAESTTDRKSNPEDRRGRWEVKQFNDSSSSEEITPWEKYTMPVEGCVYFVCDDTPPVNFFLFLKPLLARYGFFLTSWSLPERWAKKIAAIVTLLAWLVYPMVQFNPTVSYSVLHEMCHTYTFNDSLARMHLSYTPIFTRKDSFRRTTQFYDAVYKEAMTRYLTEKALTSQHLHMLRGLPQLRQNISALDMADTGKRFRLKRKVSSAARWLPL